MFRYNRTLTYGFTNCVSAWHDLRDQLGVTIMTQSFRIVPCAALLCELTLLSLTRSNYGGIMAVSHQNYEGSWLSVTRTMRDHGCQSPELWGIMAVNHQNYEGLWMSITRTMRDHGCQSPELWGVMDVNHQTTRIPQAALCAKVCMKVMKVMKAAKSAHELKNSNWANVCRIADITCKINNGTRSLYQL